MSANTESTHNMSIEAMKQALNALQGSGYYDTTQQREAITALREAIAEAEKQEPDLTPIGIGVDVTAQGATVVGFYRKPNAVWEMFYSQFHPMPKREWVGLTDEDTKILEAVRRELTNENRNGDAPGHSHQIPGIWDDDNGDRAGKPCAWCLTWKMFTAIIDREAKVKELNNGISQ